jgi:hypothetical protein
VDFNYANKNKKQLLHEFKRHLFRDIFAIQEIEYDSEKPTKATALDDEFHLESVFQLQNTPVSFIRISRIQNN